MSPPARPLRLLVILGGGGHTTEILRLVDLFVDQGAPFGYAYLLTWEDTLSEQRIRQPGPVYRVNRPSYKSYSGVRQVVGTLRALGQTLGIMLRVRPHAVVTAGPAIAVPVAVWARLLGSQVIFIETGSRVTQLSRTGRLMRPLAHLYFVQWPELCAEYPRAIYAGRLL